MGLFGGGQDAKPEYTKLQVQTASSALPIALVWGANRVAPNIFWYNDFKAHAQHQGKGGPSITSYTYTASLEAGLCQGVIHGVGKAWKDQSTVTTYTDLGFTLFTGTDPQSPWSYIVSRHPTEALSYNGLAFLAAANYDLGPSASLGAHTFEVLGLRWGSQVGGTGGDADPALIVNDFLTHPQWGVGVPTSAIDYDSLYSTVAAPTTGDSTYQTYCRAMGFGMSPALVSQESALQVIERWGKITNTAVFWSGYNLKFIPYGDEVVTANGVTYIPSTTVVYNLSDKDYKLTSGEDPIKGSRSDPADAFNIVKMEILDRTNNYNAKPIVDDDIVAINTYGVRPASTVTAHEICQPAMATIMVSLMKQRVLYVRNIYKFTLSQEYCLLELMDIVGLNDTKLGLVNYPVRITEIDEQDNGEFQVQAEQFTDGLGNTPGFNPQGTTNGSVNTLANPGPVNAPVIFEPNSTLAMRLNGTSTPIVVMAISGGDGTTYNPLWGGAYVNISTDGTNYSQVGKVSAPSRQGKLTATLAPYGGSNPDTGHTLAISTLMSNAEILSGTASDAANGVMLCYVDGEFISFETATLTGTDTYDLTTLYRGLYGTTAGSHISGTQFARIDDQVFIFQLPAAYIGVTIHIKLQSFNLWGQATQDISTCVAYTYTPTGAGSGGGTGGVPLAPTGLTIPTGGAQEAIASWNANAVTDNVIQYGLWRALGLSQPFASAVLVWSGLSLGHTDSPLAVNTGYTYFLTATNSIGQSLPTAGVNITTSNTALLTPPFGFSFDRDLASLSSGMVIRYFDTPIPWTITAAASSQTSVVLEGGSAPTAQTDIDLQVNGVSVGTIRFAIGATTATFIKASNSVLASHDITSLILPSNLNGMTGRLVGTISGTR